MKYLHNDSIITSINHYNRRNKVTFKNMRRIYKLIKLYHLINHFWIKLLQSTKKLTLRS